MIRRPYRLQQSFWTLIVCLGLFSASPAVAYNIHNLLNQRPQSAPAMRKNLTDTACQDFNGHWEGECEIQQTEDIFRDVVDIFQVGCAHLRLQHQDRSATDYEVGEATRSGKTSSLTMWNSDAHELMLWNADQSVLTLSVNANSNQLVTQEHWKEIGAQRIAFRSGKLIISIQIQSEGMIKGVPQSSAKSLVCRYNKVS